MVFAKHKRLILFLIIISKSMVFLDVTILPVALPTIQSNFHSSGEELQWMINSYLLAMSIFIVFSGRISDILGHHKILILGMLLFGLSSAFCGLSQTNAQLIISRFFQGMGAAMGAPTSTAILFETFSEKQRGHMMGIVCSAGAVAFSLGPLIGGFFTEYLSWRYIFFINVPISFFGIWIALKFVSKSPRRKESIDYLGFSSFFIGIFCLTVAIMQGRSWGWNSISILLLFFVSLICFLILYSSSKMAKLPYIDFSLFKILSFFGAVVALFTTGFARMVSIFWVIFFQNVLEFSPLLAGSFVIVSSLPMVLFSHYSGKLTDKYGAKYPIFIGQVLLILSLVGLFFFFSSGNYFLIGLFFLIFGLGTTVILIASYISSINSVHENQRGAASGILSLFRITGSNFGVAILGSILLNTQFFNFSALLAKNKETRALDPHVFEGLLSGVKPAIEAIKSLSSSTQSEIRAALKSSYNMGMDIINLSAALVVLLGLIIIVCYFKPRRKKGVVISLEP